MPSGWQAAADRKKKGLALESRHVDFLVRALASQLVCSQRRSAGGDLGE